ncbi:MAG: TonB-dependent receptor [Cyclobacteriaceae bacterium]|jgi:outer membrane receptor protein involved in Fe transport|nr:TonB-dependent receptor [Cyclobacteriaceae bacterium]
MRRSIYLNMLASLLVASLTTSVYAQTTISGTVKDAAGQPLPQANISVEGKMLGTVTNIQGQFTLTVSDPPPITIIVSYIGYETQRIDITDANTAGLDVVLSEQTVLGREVVVSASRFEESYLTSPVTVEKVDLLAIQQAPVAEFYDALANVKGVQFTSSSLNFPQVNTRGFATIANVRFVQLVDWMDTSAPLLNFPTGNIVGLGELDAESMELLPGTASALYGPNAFNGVLIMTSKSPFDYPGLSVQLKGGLTTSDAQGESFPMYNFSLRYAKSFNNKFAFKVNFSLLEAEDWKGNDYTHDINRPDYQADLTKQPNFDGVNLYGDEIQILTQVPLFGTFDLRRTGWREEDILDNRDARSIKGDVALHYRVTDELELLYNYRYGGGSSVYQGSQKYALRNFTQQFHKLELRSDDFFVRAYLTATDAGDSYNMGALGAILNEYIMPTLTPEGTGWAPTYIQTYVLAMQGYLPGVPAGDPATAHMVARANADQGRPQVGTAEFRSLVEQVRNNYFQRNPPGAKFIDNSRLFHGEFNYNFADKIDWIDILVGGNFRQYSLFSDGTIFNEDPDTGTDFKRITINEVGFFAQFTKTIAESLRLTGSLRYDKNENFDAQVTPRLSAVYTFNDSHNIRASFQTGFRNPDTQAQFIYFPAGTNTLLGSARANAERYGLHEGGAYTIESYRAFVGAGGFLDEDGNAHGADPNILQVANIDYVGPEQLRSFEIGYKGVFNDDLLVDMNAYWTSYTDFIGGDDYVLRFRTQHQGRDVLPGTIYTPYVNFPEDVTSFGVGIGITYNLPRGFSVNGTYSYATFDDNRDEDSQFRAGFNTPENKFTVGLANRKVAKNLGFAINYRWQEEFLWQSDFGEWMVPEFGVLDAQVSYKISSLKTMVKLGGTNLFGGDYRTNLGGPFVGQTYYLSLTFDEFLR